MVEKIDKIHFVYIRYKWPLSMKKYLQQAKKGKQKQH